MLTSVTGVLVLLYMHHLTSLLLLDIVFALFDRHKSLSPSGRGSGERVGGIVDSQPLPPSPHPFDISSPFYLLTHSPS